MSSLGVSLIGKGLSKSARKIQGRRLLALFQLRKAHNDFNLLPLLPSIIQTKSYHQLIRPHPRKPLISPFNFKPQSRDLHTTISSTDKLSAGILTGQKAIITGGSRGIGLAIAQRFAAEGASCILLGREEATLKNALRTLPSVSVDPDPDGGGELSGHGHFHSFRRGDVSKRGFWADLGRDDEFKTASILVNAAGTTHSSLLITTSRSLVESVIQTNLMGTIWSSQIMTKLFLRRKDKSCNIINVSSLLAIKGGIGSTAYAASKAGILGLTRSLAAEVGGSGIRVNAILPGYISTLMTDSMDEKARTKALESIPMGRFGTVEEVADAALFLATNKYATNCVLNLDGGLSAT